MIKIGCDGGCGRSSSDPKDFVIAGFLEQKHYCKEQCAPVLEAFVKARNDAHDATVIYFRKKYDQTVKKFQKQNPSFSFPDVMNDQATGPV